MAKVGAKYAKIAKITAAGDSTKLPTYDKAVKPGPLNAVDDSATFNEGQLYGDDTMQDNFSEFSTGTVTMKFTSVSDAGEKIMNSYAYEEDDNGDGHLVPGGNKDEFGFAHISMKRGRESGKQYEKYYGVFYPRLAPKYDGESVETLGGSTTLNPESVPATWMKPVNGQPKIVSKYFDTELEATGWVDKMLPDAGTAS